MKILVCNDTRNKLERKTFSWDTLKQFDTFLNGLKPLCPKDSKVDWSLTNPFLKAQQVLLESLGADITSRIRIELSSLEDTVQKERQYMNVDRMLCDGLKEDSHITPRHVVKIFDARSVDIENKKWTEIRSPKRGASALANLLQEFQPEKIVYDLQYYDEPSYGCDMLDSLHNSHDLSGLPQTTTILVYSNFLRDLGNTPEEIKRRFPKFKIECYYRLSGDQNMIKIIERCRH